MSATVIELDLRGVDGDPAHPGRHHLRERGRPDGRLRAGDRRRSASTVILDFSGLEYMNSGGIGLLVTLLVRAQRGGAHLVATGLSDHYRQIFALTRLDEAIAIHDDEAAAVAAAVRLTRPEVTEMHETSDERTASRPTRRAATPATGPGPSTRSRPPAWPAPRTTRSPASACPGRSRASASCGRRPFTVRLDGAERRADRAGRDLEGALPEFWPRAAPVLRAAGRDRPGRGRAARDPARARVARQALDRRPGPLRRRRVVHVHDPGRPYPVGMDHVLAPYRDGDVTVAQAQALERPSDPFDELAYMLGGNRQNNRFWEATLREPGAPRRGRRRRPSRPRSSASTSSASGATGATSATAPRCGPRAGR